MKTYRSLNSALRAYARAERSLNRLLTRLARIARREGLIYGWDLPTLAIEMPREYAQYRALQASLATLRAWVRWFSFVPATTPEFNS